MMRGGPILVVDDDDPSREALLLGLHTEGFGVLCADCAERGLYLMRHAQASLVLVDLCRHGGVSGPELVQLAIEEGLIDPYRVVMILEGGARSCSAARWSVPKPIDLALVCEVARDLCDAPKRVPAPELRESLAPA